MADHLEMKKLRAVSGLFPILQSEQVHQEESGQVKGIFYEPDHLVIPQLNVCQYTKVQAVKQ